MLMEQTIKPIETAQAGTIGLFYDRFFGQGPKSLAAGPLDISAERIRFWFGYKMLRTSNADDARDILVTHNDVCSKGVTVRPLINMLGMNLFNADGEEWSRRRRLEQGAFLKPEEPRCFNAIMQSLAISRARWEANPEKTLEIYQELKNNSIRLSLATLLGLHVDTEESEPLIELLDHTIGVMWDVMGDRLIRGDFLPMSVPTSNHRRYRAAAAQASAALLPLLRRRKEELGEQKDLLSMLIRSQAEAKMTDEDIIGELFNYYIASYGANAGVMTWTLMFLLQNPSIMDRVVEEILANLSPKEELTLAALDRLSYLSQVIMESMRLRPAAYVILRYADKDFELRGEPIERGTVMFVATYKMHRNPRYWQRPEEFFPEHFSPEAVAERHKYAFLPFGAGGRQCPSRGFNMLEIKTVLADMLRRYEITYDVSKPFPEEAFDLAITPKSGLHVQLRPRKSKE